jgi:hypothetical protein
LRLDLLALAGVRTTARMELLGLGDEPGVLLVLLDPLFDGARLLDRELAVLLVDVVPDLVRDLHRRRPADCSDRPADDSQYNCELSGEALSHYRRQHTPEVPCHEATLWLPGTNLFCPLPVSGL